MNTTLRRSQLHRRHLENNALFETVRDFEVVKAYPQASNEQQQATHLGLADLSTLPRIGFKGRGAVDWLAQQGVHLPGAPNCAQVQADASLVARLSQEESLTLSDLGMMSTLPDTLQQNWSIDTTEGTWLLPRRDSHCWLALSGARAADTMAKLCGVDLRRPKFADGELAQTSLARVNAIIIRNDLGTTPCFYLLGDVSSAEFLWDCLLDAMREFEGTPVAITALANLMENQRDNSD